MPPKHADQGRILLVEDSPELLRMLKRMLASEGYSVQTATTRDEALEKIMAERFHVAVIDVRLNHRDPYNYEGFQFMQDLRGIDPSTGVVLLTETADLDIVREALYSVSGEMDPIFEITRTSASAFLEKTPAKLDWLVEAVRKVFAEVVHINWELQILDGEQFVKQIPRRMRFHDSPDVSRLQEELDELLRKLFYDWDKVELRTIAEQNQGYSKAFVFQVTPIGCDGECPVIIAKIGECSVIEREVRRYRNYLEHFARGSRNPAALTSVWRTRTLGGMVYAFDGLGGEIRDFSQFFHSTKDRALIGEVIANLFINTLSVQHSGKRTIRRNVDLRTVYAPHLRLDAEELQVTLTELVAIARTVGRSALSEKFFLPEVELINPVEYAITGDFTGSYVEATIHGELHTHTVLIDKCNDTWLIDFANTGKGPLLQDYIAFEASLLVENNEIPAGRPHFEWTRALFAQPGELFPRLPPKLAENPDVAKMHHAILTVRRLAYHDLRGEQANRTYLIGLFFTTLRMMSVKFLTPPKRFQALTVAALIAENLIALEADSP